MNFLHWEIDSGPENLVEVTLDNLANVLLLDNSNFQKYSQREKYNYFGGLAKKSPVRLKPPSKGHWHVVVDLGGYGGTVRASTTVH